MHATRVAASRARFKLGKTMPIRTAIIPITTSSSTRVNARRVDTEPVAVEGLDPKL
jgi:hypothetical protein